MTDLHERMGQLSQRLADLKPRLGEVAGRYAELNSDMAPFIEHFQKQVLRYHDALLAVQREIADLKALNGDSGARDAGDVESPLMRFNTPGGPRSVQDQYDRVWRGKKDPRYEGPELPPVPPEVQQHFNEVVAAYHPALSKDEDEVAKRAEAMEKANRAYVRRDKITLAGMASMAQERSNLLSLVDESVVNQLDELVLSTEALISHLESQNAEMLYGDLGRIKGYVDAAREQGENLVAELSQEVQETLKRAHQQLDMLKGQVG